MSKTLRTAAVIVGAVALIATGVGAAAGLGAFGTVAAGSATAATLATVATVATYASFAAAALSVAATLTAKRPSAFAGGDQTKFTLNKDQGIPWAFGRTSVAGWIVHRQTYDIPTTEDNGMQSIMAVWSLGPITSIEAFQVDKVTVTFSGAGAAQGNFANYMWLRTQLGATPEASALPASPLAPTVAGWSGASKLSGYAAYSWTLKWDKKGKKFPNGVPQPSAILKCAKVWDPRKDSSYPGGSGSHRPNDPATWEWSENPWLLGLQWARGLFQNGKRVMGIGMALAAIDVPAFVEAANIADANEWTCGGVAYSTDGKWDVMKKFCAAGSGEPLQLGGLLSCMFDTPRVSLATIRTEDIIGDASVTATPASRDRINGVIPKYRSEEHDWNLVPAEPVAVSDYVLADGRPRTRELTWEYVQDVDQVAELATYAIVNAREFGPIVTPLKLKWIGYKPGDCLTIESPELGMDSQTVLIQRRSLDPSSGAVTLTMRSETTAKHAYALGKTGTPPPTPSLQVLGSDLPVPGYNAGWTGVEDDDPENHPRPEDGADKTENHFESVFTDQLGRTPGEVTGDLDITLETVAKALLKQGTFFDLVNQETTLPDGTRIRTWAQTVGLNIDGTVAFVTDLREVTSDGLVKAVLSLNSDLPGLPPVISGMTMLNDGEQASIYFAADEFGFIDIHSGEGGVPTKPFYYIDDVLYIRHARAQVIDVDVINAQNLQAGALGYTDSATTGSTFHGSGSAPSSAYQTVIDFDIHLEHKADVTIMVGGVHSYIEAAGDYGVVTLFDGVDVHIGAAGGAGDYVNTWTDFHTLNDRPPGDHNLKLLWRGSNGIHLIRGRVLVIVTYTGGSE